MNNNTHWCQEPGNCCGYLARAVDRLARILEDPDTAAGCAEMLDQHGTAFAAFLLAANGVDLDDAVLRQQFNERHVGSYRDWYELRDVHAEWSGWTDALAKLEGIDGVLLGDFLTWDDAAVRAYLHERYEILQVSDRIYVFERNNQDLKS